MTTIPLTDHQRAVLTMAAYSTNLLAWPLPKRLKLGRGSTTIVVKGLLKKAPLRSGRPSATIPSGGSAKTARASRWSSPKPGWLQSG